MASRLHPHSSLPAPVVHTGFSISQSKSHVLAGVQDAYWSDDEAVSYFKMYCMMNDLQTTFTILSRRMQSARFALKRWTFQTSISSRVFVVTKWVPYHYIDIEETDAIYDRFVDFAGIISRRT